MSSPAIVEVWALLQSRRDTTNLLREILGDYTLSVTGKPVQTILALSFRLLVWIKVIFDMQRTYLQNIDPSPESKSKLIDPSTLFATIRHIIDIQYRVYSRQVGVSDEYLSQRCFIAGVVLSGLRALLLREGSFSPDEVEEMRVHISEWRTTARRQSLEVAILDKCQYALDSVLSSGERVGTSFISVHRPACDVLELPDSEDIFLPRLKTDECFASELQELRERNNEHSFWVLFDILWAAEGALIQNPEVVVANKYATHLNVQNVEEACLKAVLLGWSNGYHPSHAGQPDCAQDRALQTYLGHIRDFLNDRNRKLLASQVEISELSSRLRKSIESWFLQASGINPRDLMRESRTAYVLHCPRLHVVPVHELQGVVSRPSTEENQSLELWNSNLLNVSFMCPICEDREHLVRRARRVEPLDELSEAVKQIMDRSSETQDLTPSGPVHDGINSVITDPSSIEGRRPSSLGSMPQPPSAISRSTDDSTPSNSSSNEKRLSISKVFSFGRGSYNDDKKPSKTKTVPESLPKSHCFSADGEMIMLWTVRSNSIFASFVPEANSSPADSTLRGHRYIVEGVRQVAGGGNLVAAVSGERMLLVFSQSRGDEAILYTAVDGTDTIRSIAVCPYGRYVALGLDRRLIVWNMKDTDAISSHSFRLEGVLGQKIDSQVASFGHGSQIIIATRDSTGTVELSVRDPTGHGIWARTESWTDSMSWENDLGLSSVLYDRNTNYAIITAFINHSYHVVQSSKAKGLALTGWNRNMKYKFQGAAQSPSESIFTLVDAYGQLYTLDARTRRITEGVKLPQKRLPNSRDDLITLSMVNDTTVRACWNEGGKVVLATVVKGQTKPEVLRFNNLD